MISKGPHLREQPAEQRTRLTNELLNIPPSLPCLLLHLIHFCQLLSFFLHFLFAFLIFSLSCVSVFYQQSYSMCFSFSWHVDMIPLVSGALWYVSLRPLKTEWADTSLHSLSTASSCSNKFISLRRKDQASYTHTHTRWIHHVNRHRPWASGRGRWVHDAGSACGFRLIRHAGGQHCWLIKHFDVAKQDMPV